MSHGTKRHRASMVWWIIGGVCLALFAADLASAAPARRPPARRGPRPNGAKPPAGGPKRPAGAVRPRAGTPPRNGRPAPPKARHDVRANGKVARYHRSVNWRATHHYWHPVRVPTQTQYVYSTVGYPYYVGGTNYTVVVPETTGSTYSGTTVKTETESAGASGRYSQMLEVTEMIHEWRTLNESAQFQARLPAKGDEVTPEVQRLVQKIKRLNQQFDEQSRKAMEKLAASQDADRETRRSADALTSLMEAAEALPEPA